MLRRLTERVLRWTDAVPSSSRPSQTNERVGFVLELSTASGDTGTGHTVLVDPPTLTEDECAQIERLGVPTHILLTCEWHTREAARHRDRWGCRVLMHRAGAAAIPIDGTLEDGALLWGAVRVVHLPDVYYPEEVALLVETDRPAPFLIVGDALSGGREDQGIPDGEVGLHAPRYVADVARAHAALARLLDVSFDGVGFGHGTPVPAGGRAAVERCLRSEVAWLASDGQEGDLTRLATWPSGTLLRRYEGRAAGERAWIGQAPGE